jgi:hypothetical protein
MTQTTVPHRLSDILDALVGENDGETVTLGKLIRVFGSASFGSVLLLTALISILPIVGALPGVSLGTAAIANMLALQMLFGRTTPWIPARLARIKIPRKALKAALTPLRPWVDRLDRRLGPRYTFLLHPPFLWIGALVATVLALGMLVGALVPLGIIPAAIGMIVLALGMTLRDGLLVAISILVTTATVVSAVWVLL